MPGSVWSTWRWDQSFYYTVCGVLCNANHRTPFSWHIPAPCPHKTSRSAQSTIDGNSTSALASSVAASVSPPSPSISSLLVDRSSTELHSSIIKATTSGNRGVFLWMTGTRPLLLTHGIHIQHFVVGCWHWLLSRLKISWSFTRAKLVGQRA